MIKNSEKLRLFLGIPISSSLAEYFFQQAEEISKDVNFRITPTNNMHITVFFLGDTTAEQLEIISHKVDKALVDFPAFQLEFKNVDLAPASKPYMLWANFYPNNTFKQLCEKVENFISSEKKRRKQKAHVTLARFSKLHTENIDKDKFTVKNYVLHVNELMLYRSILKPEGPEYLVLDVFSLKK